MIVCRCISLFSVRSCRNNSNQSTRTRLISPTDVACALVLLKQRYRLSISFINHLLKLLPKILLLSVPPSWNVVKSLLRNNKISSPSRITTICPSCSSASFNRDLCSVCEARIRHSSTVKYFHNFNISDQLHRIILGWCKINDRFYQCYPSCSFLPFCPKASLEKHVLVRFEERKLSKITLIVATCA